MKLEALNFYYMSFYFIRNVIFNILHIIVLTLIVSLLWVRHCSILQMRKLSFKEVK